MHVCGGNEGCPPSFSRNISDPMKSCAHDFLCKQGRPQCTFRMTCASERSGSAHSIRHVHFRAKPLHMSSNLCKQGGGFGTSFSCARTIIGQRTLTKLINRRACRSPCALQHATTTSLLIPCCNSNVTLCSNSMAPKSKKQTAAKKEAKPKSVIA